MAGANIDVPAEYDDWPHDARAFVLAEANTAVDLREEINSLVGFTSEDLESDSAAQFTKEELAELIMALGGPQEASH